MRRLLIVLAAVAALAGSGASAEDVCIDAGAVGPVELDVPAVCVPVP